MSPQLDPRPQPSVHGSHYHWPFWLSTHQFWPKQVATVPLPTSKKEIHWTWPSAHQRAALFLKNYRKLLSRPFNQSKHHHLSLSLCCLYIHQQFLLRKPKKKFLLFCKTGFFFSFRNGHSQSTLHSLFFFLPLTKTFSTLFFSPLSNTPFQNPPQIHLLLILHTHLFSLHRIPFHWEIPKRQLVVQWPISQNLLFYPLRPQFSQRRRHRSATSRTEEAAPGVEREEGERGVFWWRGERAWKCVLGWNWAWGSWAFDAQGVEGDRKCGSFAVWSVGFDGCIGFGERGCEASLCWEDGGLPQPNPGMVCTDFQFFFHLSCGENALDFGFLIELGTGFFWVFDLVMSVECIS